MPLYSFTSTLYSINSYSFNVLWHAPKYGERVQRKAVLVIAVLAVVAIVAYFAFTSKSEGPVKLLGSGSTFVRPAMDVWIREFTAKHSSISIEYAGGGSGKGLSDFFGKLVDFACSDPPLPKDKWEKHRGKVLQFPVVLGAIVIVYNVPEIGNVHLNLTGEVLAKIYLGEIKYWDDPEIKKLNPAVAQKLPHREIIAVHRSDSSGSTQVFTLFLAKTYPRWKQVVGVGKTVEWPVDKIGRGIGAKGNPGVVQAIKTTPYSIGYVELAYALSNNLPYARIQNPLGEFVLATPQSISRAAKIGKAPSPLDDWTDISYNMVYANVENAYPITSPTYMIVWKKIPDKNKCKALKEFIQFIGTEGQTLLPEGYAPLSQELKDVVVKAANLLECS
ncbi:MAG TPA: phosphate ABC transporter substrate-binding protein PstS [Pyrodictium sp.]|nr:phosphate ABC transporter substrate-binding protein PstS [Pyrodictium sp.]